MTVGIAERSFGLENLGNIKLEITDLNQIYKVDSDLNPDLLYYGSHTDLPNGGTLISFSSNPKVLAKDLIDSTIYHEYSHSYVKNSLGGRNFWDLSNQFKPGADKRLVHFEEFLVDTIAYEKIPNYKFRKVEELVENDRFMNIIEGKNAYRFIELYSLTKYSDKVLGTNNLKLFNIDLEKSGVFKSDLDKINEVSDLFIENIDLLEKSASKGIIQLKKIDNAIEDLRLRGIILE